MRIDNTRTITAGLCTADAWTAVGRKWPWTPSGASRLCRKASQVGPQEHSGHRGRSPARRGRRAAAGSSKVQSRVSRMPQPEPKLGAPSSVKQARPTVPVARAPSFSVSGLLNSLPRLLLKKAGSFAQFLRNMLTPGPCKAPMPYTWPSPLPYPDVLSKPSGRGGWKRKLLALAFACLSWLCLGKACSCPAELRLGVPLNWRQQRALKLLEGRVFGSTFPIFFDAAGLGRDASKVKSHSDVLAALLGPPLPFPAFPLLAPSLALPPLLLLPERWLACPVQLQQTLGL